MDTREAPDQHAKLTVPVAATRASTPPDATPLPDLDVRLDEALELTFPASDPVSVSA